jgi:hypothetical protein
MGGLESKAGGISHLPLIFTQCIFAVEIASSLPLLATTAKRVLFHILTGMMLWRKKMAIIIQAGITVPEGRGGRK